ncbi:hypothetical protein [Solimicrobium silvestre]|uniref:Bacterial type III secretion apparatus protein n=1 Tax=Solimicrobium silvestre TaxID=2099400 RepID=A0A2S9H1M4_9BURK|nr:hypothetical protein [Solimicrobium silvestre]PRC93879.1 Bacterial type III secretion apparatus protein [Solimicrobium silvestre]
MKKRINVKGEAWLAQIIFDPLSYVHPRRLRLPVSLDTPRQRAIVNRMLLGDLAEMSNRIEMAQQQLLRHWRDLPYICTLIGAQLMRQDLAWRGRLLTLPAPVLFFMSLPIRQAIGVTSEMSALPARCGSADVLHQVQGAGVSCILDWQMKAPSALLERMRLMFPPELDGHFESARKPPRASELFLILQAIQYAKNHPNLV